MHNHKQQSIQSNSCLGMENFDREKGGYGNAGDLRLITRICVLIPCYHSTWITAGWNPPTFRTVEYFPSTVLSFLVRHYTMFMPEGISFAYFSLQSPEAIETLRWLSGRSVASVMFRPQSRIGSDLAPRC